MNSVDVLKTIEADIYNNYHVRSMPAGDNQLHMILDMAHEVLNRTRFEAITEEELDALTDSNFHAVRHAVEILQLIYKYRF